MNFGRKYSALVQGEIKNPMEMIGDNGDSINDINVVFERWKNGFMILYNHSDFDETH